VLVADFDVHELAREVEVLASGVVPDAASAPAGDDQRRQLRLRRPGVEHMVAVERAGEFVEVLGEVLGHGFDAFLVVRWASSAGRSPTRIETCDRSRYASPGGGATRSAGGTSFRPPRAGARSAPRS